MYEPIISARTRSLFNTLPHIRTPNAYHYGPASPRNLTNW